jgi:23S rRNA (adenine2030-N6)-methyltransferase
MLSYRHGFHAGNPADVFKHAVLVALVRAMQHKDKGIRFVDTHAGPALYALDSEFAQKNREHERGIARLWQHAPDSPELADYLEQVRVHNPDGRLTHYPGSPLLLRDLLRPQDELFLCELHRTEQRALSERFADDRQVTIHGGDGYAALTRLLPPPTGRGLVLIDPPFELKTELDDIAHALEQALDRYGHGVYAIWYPLIEGRDCAPDALPRRLELEGERWLDLRIEFAPEQRLGRMHGCGMAIINCPFRARQPLLALQSMLDHRSGRSGATQPAIH